MAVSMPLRTVKIRSLFWSTFMITYIASIILMLKFPITAGAAATAGAGGAFIGLLFKFLQKKTTQLEENYKKAREERGEKIQY